MEQRKLKEKFGNLCITMHKGESFKLVFKDNLLAVITINKHRGANQIRVNIQAPTYIDVARENVVKGKALPVGVEPTS